MWLRATTFSALYAASSCTRQQPLGPEPPGSRCTAFAMALTVGTAGHIDHGKTWLVRALTGKDTDRLPEEQRRGISIDLGYAPLDLPDGRRLSLIDVPGHERFVRTMVAGATGIDLFLLVIDAAEGARPQTLEHLAILRLLGVSSWCGRDHQGRLGRPRDARDRDRGGARARAGGRGGRGQRQDRRGPGRAPGGAGAGRRHGVGTGRQRPGPPLCRPCLHTQGHRHGRHGHALVGEHHRGGYLASGAAWWRCPGALGAGARQRCRRRDSRRACGAGLAGNRAQRSPPGRRARHAGRLSGLVPPRRRARGTGTDRERRARVGTSRHLPRRGESGEGGREVRRSCG